MEITYLSLDKEWELDLHLDGVLTDDRGGMRNFRVRIAEQDVIRFDDYGMTRAEAGKADEFIHEALFGGDDVLGIFKAMHDAAEAIEKSIANAGL